MIIFTIVGVWFVLFFLTTLYDFDTLINRVDSLYLYKIIKDNDDVKTARNIVVTETVGWMFECALFIPIIRYVKLWLENRK